MSPFIGQYIEYSQAFSNTPPKLEEISEVFHTYDSKQLLQLFCKINIALWKASETKENTKLQLHLFNTLFSKGEKDQITANFKKLKKDRTHTVIFHRH